MGERKVGGTLPRRTKRLIACFSLLLFGFFFHIAVVRRRPRLSYPLCSLIHCFGSNSQCTCNWTVKQLLMSGIEARDEEEQRVNCCRTCLAVELVFRRWIRQEAC